MYYYQQSIFVFSKIEAGGDITSRSFQLKEYKDSFYIVTWKTRNRSSESESSVKKGFKTFASMLDYLKEHVSKYALKEYNEEDLYTNNTMSIKATKPTQEFLDVLLHPSRLYNCVVHNGGGIIYNPYSRSAMQVPFEFSVEVIDIYQ